MKRKINLRLIEIAILAICMITIGMTIVYYEIYQSQVKKDLRMIGETLSMTQIFTDTSSREIDALKLPVENLRITWIAADGTVLYDNDVKLGDMKNHSDRPEVQSALKCGEGVAVRDSNTMNRKSFYYAMLQQDGTILRVATGARSSLNLFLSGFPLIISVLLMVIIVCIAIAHFLTRQFLLPIQNIVEHLDDTTQMPEYKELVPLVRTIRSQHENILKAAKARQDFTANVSHELKTPLTAISGYAELIENRMVDEGQTIHFAKEIGQNANRLLTLINDIIRLSEIDLGENSITYEEIDLNEVAGACMENLQVNAKGREISLEYIGRPCMLVANAMMMRELIENLGENAIRYNNPGGHVRVYVFEENEHAVLLVSDDGIGIPKDQQERVFERFYRVDKSRSRRTGGTGLGLAIVKHIVALHDAKLTLDSEPGRGTDIRIEF